MDAAGVALRQPLKFSSSSYAAVPSSSLKESRTSSASVAVGRRRTASGILASGFIDQGHLQYYNSNHGRSSSVAAAGMRVVMSGKQEKATKDMAPKKMKKKKMLKLLKGLSRDLSTFSQIGFGLDADGGLADQVKGNMISEAADLLLEQLQKLRAEEKELKKKVQKEKAMLKAAQMQNNCEVSSSSCSESSDSDCGEVVDMNSLKRAQANKIGLQQVLEEAGSPIIAPIMPTITSLQPNVPEAMPVPSLPSTPIPEENTTLPPASSCSIQNEGCLGTSNSCREKGNLGGENINSLVAPTCSKKIEVCMGGKCKKSGAPALLEEFQRVLGVEGTVTGCKCMGKCRDGPNVKVLNGFDAGVADSSVRAPPSSLCMGVGLDDVGMIVANFLGENHIQPGFAAVS